MTTDEEVMPNPALRGTSEPDVAEGDGQAEPFPLPVDPAEALRLLAAKVREYGKHERHHKVIVDSAKAQRDEITEWEKEESGKDAAAMRELDQEMRRLARMLLPIDPKHRKTVSTTYGEVSFREGRESIEVWDQDDFMAWALNEHPSNSVVWHMVRERPAPDPEPSITAIRECIRDGNVVVDEFGLLSLKGEDGERIPIPGVRQVKAEETFTVKPR